MPDIAQVMLPTGDLYDIKDSTARQQIQDIEASITGAMHYVGITTTPLTDGSTTSTIVIDGESETFTARDAGAVAIYGNEEFVWNGTKWQEFGSTGSLKALAFKDTASTTYTPAGSVSQPTFTGNAATINAVGTPSGTVSKPTFTGTSKTVNVTGTATGNVAISVGTGTANYTPEGTVSKPTFTGTLGNVSVSGTPFGSVSISTGNGTSNYTPAGSVSQPTTTVTMNTTTVNSITDVGTLPTCTLPTWTGTVTNENLIISWSNGDFSQGTLPTKGSNQTVATTVKSATTSQPTFTGTGVELTASFTGTASTSTGTFTPEGSVSQPTFTGTGKELKASFSGTSFTSSGSYTPEGSVSQPTFTGNELTSTTSYTPEGTVSKPTFTGTQTTITVS